MNFLIRKSKYRWDWKTWLDCLQNTSMFLNTLLLQNNSVLLTFSNIKNPASKCSEMRHISDVNEFQRFSDVSLWISIIGTEVFNDSL